MQFNPRCFLVFDVESVGLHGESFAVGWSVVDLETRREEDAGWCWAYPDLRSDDAQRDAGGVAFVKQHVLPALAAGPSQDACEPRFATAPGVTPRDVVAYFWRHVVRPWTARGAVLAADVPWPVEARFLARAWDHYATGRDASPYPIVDVASVRLGAGLDPTETMPRLPREMPAHHPLSDARQSARLLLEALASRSK